MLEPKVEKKLDPQQLINDLKAQHAQEIMTLVNKNVENRQKAISDLELRHTQEIQRVQEENRQREGNLLIECNTSHQARTEALIVAVLKTRSQRDMALLTLTCIAFGILGTISLRGFIYTRLSKILMFAAIAAFVSTIIVVGENLKRHSLNLKRVMAGTIQLDLIWKDADNNGPSRFLIFGFISTALLGITLFMNPQAKNAPTLQLPATPVALQVQLQTTNAAAAQATTMPIPKSVSDPLPSATKIPQKSGNGGIFVGGNFK